MSYKPPTTGPYGDSDFSSDDSWSNQTTNPTGNTLYRPQPPLTPTPPPAAQYMQYPTNQLHNARFNAPPMQGTSPLDPMARPAPDFAAMTSSITQEDIMFMRKFRHDLFLYRILPISVIGCGSLYWYNKTKNLPNTIGRYMLVGAASLIIGVSSFRSGMKKMVEESRINTPYMQAVRRSLNLPPLENVTDGDYGMEYGNKQADGTSNWHATELAGDLRYPTTMDNNSPSQNTAPFGHDNLQDMNAPKPPTSYEELRARNRGYIK